VPGATLHLDVNNGNRTVEESAMEQGLDRIRGERVAVAADGTFRIEGIDTTFHDHVTLVGAAPGWFPRRMEVAVAAGNTTEGVRVDLRPGLELTGTLLRADGSPAAGVPVQFCVVPEGSFGSTGVAPQAVTAADGSFSIRPVPDRHLCLNFGPDPSKPIQRVNGVWAKDPPVEARLPSLRSVRGRAVSVSGDPAPDVAVRFLVEGGGAGAPSPTTRTAADGTFAFPEVPDRQFRLWFGGPLAQESGDFLEKRTEAYPVGTNGVEVALERAFAIEGVVEDADGKPQSLAWLAASAEDRAAGVPRHHDSTDERGKFRITGLRAGNYRVQAARDESRAMAEGVAAGTRGLRLRLSDEGAVRGRVVDASGALVPRAQVYVTSVGPQGVSSIGVTADEQGRFGVAGDKGTDYVVEAEGGSRGKARVESVPGGTRDLEVRLGASRGGALSGRVLDAEGRPAADVLVHARRLATDMVPEEAINLFARDGAGQEPEVPLPRGEDRRDARTGADGAYDFGDMPAGRWVLWAGGPATAWRPSAAARFEGAGGPVELRVERGWTLRTRLVDAEGKPRLFVSVMVQVPGAPPGPAFRVVLQTGRGGMLELPGLPPGPVTILECNVQPAPAWTVPEQAPGAEPETLRPKE
jgi:hypothetical protein